MAVEEEEHVLRRELEFRLKGIETNMISGFKSLHQRHDKTDERLDRVNGHIDNLRIFRTRVMAVIATLGVITTGALSIAGVAMAVAMKVW